MEKTSKYLYVDYNKVVECCASCEHRIEYYGCDMACSVQKYKRFYLGKYHIDEKYTRPEWKCEKYKGDKRLFKKG